MKPEPCCNKERPCVHWRSFEKQCILAHLRWRLTREAELISGVLIGEQIEPDADTVALLLAKRVGEARPRSTFIPWGVGEEIVERMISVVATDIATKTARAA
jgi:hypothetical protein